MHLWTALSRSVALLPLAIAGVRCGTPADVHQVFVSQTQNETKLRYVNDSGVCETTPGVHQSSGYVDIGKNMSIVRHTDIH
jgi:hypothetical protein